jgi:hypothetical protein
VIPVFEGRVEAPHRLILVRPEAFRSHVAGLVGHRVEAIVRRRRSQRSTQQNRYYWGVVIRLFAAELGYTPDEMHEALKQQFLRIADKGPLPTVRSTADLDTAEYERYLDDCRMLAASVCGLVIPLPNEAIY